METPVVRPASQLKKGPPGPPSNIGEGLTVEKAVKAIEVYARECATQNSKEFSNSPPR